MRISGIDVSFVKAVLNGRQERKVRVALDDAKPNNNLLLDRSLYLSPFARLSCPSSRS